MKTTIKVCSLRNQGYSNLPEWMKIISIQVDMFYINRVYYTILSIIT
jgi:hypothetical protein